MTTWASLSSHQAQGVMPKTKPRTGSYTMRFAKVGHRIVAFSSIRKHVGGEGRKQRFIRLFNSEGPVTDLKPKVFQAAVMDGKIQKLDLPHGLKEDAEELSQQIGPTYTPQEALRIFQGIIQDHGTTLNAEVIAHE